MIAGLKTWFERSLQRRRERVAAQSGSLSTEEQREVERLREEHRATSVWGAASPDRDFGNRPGT